MFQSPYKKGNPAPILRTIEERNELFLKNMGLIGWALTRFPVQVRTLGDETARDLLELALLRVCGQWDPQRGALSTLMHRAAMNALNHEVGRSSRRLAPITLGFHDVQPDSTAAFDNFSELGRLDPPTPEADEDRQYLLSLIRQLPWAEKDVVRMRFLRELSLTEIGLKLGICKERVRQIAERALERLREAAGLLPVGTSHRARLAREAKARAKKIRALRRQRRRNSA